MLLYGEVIKSTAATARYTAPPVPGAVPELRYHLTATRLIEFRTDAARLMTDYADTGNRSGVYC